MTYYDNATAIAYKLDRWSKESAPRKFAIEQIAREHCTSSTLANTRMQFRRALHFFASRIPGLVTE